MYQFQKVKGSVFDQKMKITPPTSIRKANINLLSERKSIKNPMRKKIKSRSIIYSNKKESTPQRSNGFNATFSFSQKQDSATNSPQKNISSIQKPIKPKCHQTQAKNSRQTPQGQIIKLIKNQSQNLLKNKKKKLKKSLISHPSVGSQDVTTTRVASTEQGYDIQSTATARKTSSTLTTTQAQVQIYQLQEQSISNKLRDKNIEKIRKYQVAITDHERVWLPRIVWESRLRRKSRQMRKSSERFFDSVNSYKISVNEVEKY